MQSSAESSSLPRPALELRSYTAPTGDRVLHRPLSSSSSRSNDVTQHLEQSDACTNTRMSSTSLQYGSGSSNAATPRRLKFRRKMERSVSSVDQVGGRGSWEPKPPVRSSSMASTTAGSIGHHQDHDQDQNHNFPTYHSMTNIPMSSPVSASFFIDDACSEEGYMSACSYNTSRRDSDESRTSAATSVNLHSRNSTNSTKVNKMEVESSVPIVAGTQPFPTQEDRVAEQEDNNEDVEEADSFHTPDEEEALAELESLSNPDRAKSLTEARARAKARRQRIASMSSKPAGFQNSADSIDDLQEILATPRARHHSTVDATTETTDEPATSTVVKVAPSLTWSHAQFDQYNKLAQPAIPIYGHTVPLPVWAKGSSAAIGGNAARRMGSLDRSNFYAQAYAELRAMDSGLHSFWMKQYEFGGKHGGSNSAVQEFSAAVMAPIEMAAELPRKSGVLSRKPIASIDFSSMGSGRSARSGLSQGGNGSARGNQIFEDGYAPRITAAGMLPLPTPPIDVLMTHENDALSNTDSSSADESSVSASSSFATALLSVSSSSSAGSMPAIDSDKDMFAEEEEEEEAKEEEEHMETITYASQESTPTRAPLPPRSPSRSSSRASQVRSLISIPNFIRRSSASSPSLPPPSPSHSRAPTPTMMTMAPATPPMGSSSGATTPRRKKMGAAKLSIGAPMPYEQQQPEWPTPLGSPSYFTDSLMTSKSTDTGYTSGVGYTKHDGLLSVSSGTSTPIKDEAGRSGGKSPNLDSKRKKMRNLLRGNRPVTSDGIGSGPQQSEGSSGNGLRFPGFGGSASSRGDTNNRASIGLGLGSPTGRFGSAFSKRQSHIVVSSSAQPSPREDDEDAFGSEANQVALQKAGWALAI
ncbi:hypothetical protein CF327_g2954 [Tilletia walkeri]|nr:hypothetical protein CF327_g2954 [Tilletia walkeri]